MDFSDPSSFRSSDPSSNQTSPRFGKVRTIVQVVYFGLISFVVIIAILLQMIEATATSEQVPASVFFMVGGIITASSVAAALILPRLMLDRIPKNQVALRLNGYVISRILFGALIEGVGIFWGVLAMITKEPLALIGSGIAVAILVAWFPTQFRMEELLEMTEAEADRALGYSDV